MILKKTNILERLFNTKDNSNGESIDLNSIVSSILNKEKIKDENVVKVHEMEEGIYVLLDNGNLYCNEELVATDINNIWNVSVLEYVISNDNVINCINCDSEAVRYINYNDYSYKKVVAENALVGLTYENDLRVILGESCFTNGIDYKRFSNIDDIYTAKGTIMIKEHGKDMLLFVELL